MFSNAGVFPWDLFGSWIAEVVGARRDIVVAMDWTDFDPDNQCTLALIWSPATAEPRRYFWLTVDKDELKDQRNDFEDLCLSRLKELLPKGVTATILADRGFGDVKLFKFLDSLGFHLSSAFAATFTSAQPMAKRGRPPIGSARADGRENCAAPKSPPPAKRSGRSSA